MSHDLTTHTTTALLYGTNACVCDYTAFDHADPSAPTRKHTEQFILTPEADRVPARNTDLLELVRRAHKAWEHPLILPCLIVSYHTKRAKWFVEHGKVQSETHEIENALGVRGDDRPPSEFWSAALNVRTTMTRAGQEGRKEAETWTIRMNRQGLRILFTERSPEWDRECSEFLKGVLDEIKTLSHVDGTTHRKLREGLEYNITTATVVSSHLANMKGRMELQLDVLNSIVSQMDSQLSARMAASAGRDSTSMKILAVITAFFLPATFVATLFSMSMFDWQWQPPSPGDNSGGDNGEGVVSDRFWIYWSTAIPLTLVTLIGWGTWWLWEIYTFDKEFTEVAGEQSEVVKKVQWFKRLVKWLIGMKTRRGSVISTSDGMTKNDAAV